MSAASDNMRREWGRNDAIRDAGQTTPENIRRFDNIAYGADTEWNLLDVYRLKNASGKSPVIVIVHGGGWVYGTKDLYQFYAMGLAQRGFTVVNFSYRLAPEVKFPAALEDTAYVISWMYKNAEQYEFDMEQVCMVGDSAGGHLLGLFCGICTDPEYAAQFSFLVPNGFRPRAVGMNCGAYQLFQSDGNKANETDQELMKDFLPEGGSAREQKLINVTEHVNSLFPPVYIMTAKGDFLLSQALLLEKACQEAGVYYESKVYGDETNPLYHVFHVNMTEPEAKICNDEECDFFRRMLR
jgi:acetyl esterase/lipase